MANVDGPFGLRAVKRLDGLPLGGTTRCVIAAGDATATFIGDAVKIAGTAIDGYPTVVQAAATEVIYGVVEGFENATPDNLTDQYRKASTQRFCQVRVADAMTLYEIQGDGVGGAAPITDVGLNASIVVGAGDTATGRSGMELDSNTPAATATLELKIQGIVDREDNEAGSANQVFLVSINMPQTGGAATPHVGL